MTAEIDHLKSSNLNMSSNLDDDSEKIRSLETNLDSAYKEITALQKKLIEGDSALETSARLEEQKAELSKSIDDQQRSWNQERDQLHGRLQDLQDAAHRAEASSARREENLRHELAESAERIKDGERRNHELSGAIQGATRPLLRQIENLQMTNSSQQESFEAIEKQLNNRINDLQEQLTAQNQADKEAKATVAEIRGQFTVLKEAKQSALDEKSRLTQEYNQLSADYEKESVPRFCKFEQHSFGKLNKV